MSTNINITVGDNALLDAAKNNQTANRQNQLEREASKKLEAEATDARTKALASQRKDANGNPLYGVLTAKPNIDRRPAANRFGQGLNLGHIWVFRNAINRFKSSGVLFSGISQNLSDVPRGSLGDLLLGCGNGNQWLTFDDVGITAAPDLPGDTFTASEGPRELQNTVPRTALSLFSGLRTAGSEVNSEIRYFEIALPCGQGNFIFVTGYASIWDSYQISATFGTTALYTATNIYQEINEFPFTGFFNTFTNQYQGSFPDALDLYSIENNGFTGYRGKERRFAAYVCNNSSIREINIPQTMQPFLAAACPEPIDITRTVILAGKTFIHNVYDLPNPTATVGPNIGLRTDATDSAVYTPSVFKSINDSISFTNSTNIKTIPTSLYQGLADRSAGTWQAFQDTSTNPEYPWMSRFYREGNPFYYALWPNKNEEPNVEIWDPAYAPIWETFPTPRRVPKATLTLSTDRVPRNGANDPDNIYGPTAYNTEQLVSVWDWDDPAYCRSMCLALGFTEADLTP